MATATTKLITAEEFAQMPDPPDGSLQELVNGEIETMPPPKGKHGVCCSRVDRLIGNFVDEAGLGWVTSNDTGFVLARDPDTVRGPDIAFYRKDRVPQVPDDYFEVPPDLAVEVVSPSDSHSKLQIKVRSYLQRGVRMVWLVDPELRIVTVYRTLNESRTLEEEHTLSGEDVLPGFSVPVSKLFPA